MDAPNLVTRPSRHGFDETLRRLLAVLQEKGVAVFAQIDHAEGAAQAGIPLRPTTVVIFGNPVAGTPVMQADQRAGLDLPLKVLVWQDAADTVSVTYRDPARLAADYEFSEPAIASLTGLSRVMDAIVQAATGP